MRFDGRNLIGAFGGLPGAICYGRSRRVTAHSHDSLDYGGYLACETRESAVFFFDLARGVLYVGGVYSKSRLKRGFTHEITRFMIESAGFDDRSS